MRTVPLLLLTLAAAAPHAASPALAAAPRPTCAPQEGDVVRASQREIDDAIDAGVRYILSRQQLDGSWKPDEHRYVAGQTGLCVYTLLKGGVRLSHPAVQRGIAFMRAHPPRWTYGIACCLLAYQTADPALYRDEIEGLAEILLECHGRGFSYPGHHEDLSLTQYGCLGLRAAEAAGIEISKEVWSEILDFAESVRDEEGGFSYRPESPDTGSMTAAGIAIFQICRDALEAKRALPNRRARQIDESIDASVEWLGRHLRMDVNPDPSAENDGAGHMTRWRLYYLYGLERVGGLTGRSTFGPHDWYAKASTALVRDQGKDGQWTTRNGEAHPGTCFGVLVLKRATAPTSGKAPRAPRSYGEDDPKHEVSLRVTGDAPLSAWISSWGERTRERFEWNAERGKGPRVWRVEYVDQATGDVLATVPGKPDEPCKGERFPAQFQMAAQGDYEIFARVVLRPIDDTEGEELEVRSPTLKVRVDGVHTPAMREATLDLTRNELANTRCEVSASTVANAGNAAHFAVDGTHGHGWLSAKEDPEPWILVEPDRPQRGTHVVLSPHVRAPRETGAWGRAKRVLLKVNRKTVGEFELVDDPMAKTYIPLKQRTTVRSIRVEVLERIDGSGGHGKALGFAEVELQLRPELLKEQQRAARKR